MIGKIEDNQLQVVTLYIAKWEAQKIFDDMNKVSTPSSKQFIELLELLKQIIEK